MGKHWIFVPRRARRRGKTWFQGRKGWFSRGVAHPGPAPPAGEGPERGVGVGPQKHVVFRRLCSAPVKKLSFLSVKHHRKPVRFAMSARVVRRRVKTRHFRAGRAAAARESAGFRWKPPENTGLLRPGAQNWQPLQCMFRIPVQILRVFSVEVRPGAPPPFTSLVPAAWRGARPGQPREGVPDRAPGPVLAPGPAEPGPGADPGEAGDHKAAENDQEESLSLAPRSRS